MTFQIKEVMKKAPLFCCVIVCMIAFGILNSVKVTQEKLEMAKLERIKEEERVAQEKERAAKEAEASGQQGGGITVPGMTEGDDAAALPPDGITRGFVTPFKTVSMRQARSPYYEDNDQVAMSTEYPYIPVSSTYYLDTLFIGDSRIAGLHDYGNLPGATFAYREGVSVFNLQDTKLITGEDDKISVDRLLSSKQYGKIYVMMGINELGKGTSSDFAEKYKENIDFIRSKQPNAIIVIMGIMKVTPAYSAKSKVFNNDNIDDRNQRIARFANGIDTFYLDVSESVGDEEGLLNPEYSWDGVHLKAQYYKLWVEYMNTRGYVKRGA